MTRQQREDEIVARFTAPFAGTSIDLAPGDDAAAFPMRMPSGGVALVTVDGQTLGKDFTSNDDPFLIGRYAVSAACSDIGAMGGRTRAILVDLILPFGTDDSYIARLGEGVAAGAAAHSASVVGGDTEHHPDVLRLGVTCLGYVDGERIVRRTGARAGDLIAVVGAVGRPLARCVADGFVDSTAPFLEDLSLALIGAETAERADVRAGCDTSDGVLRAVAILADAGGLGFRLTADDVALDRAARSLCDRGVVTPRDFVVSHLSDHLLVYAVERSAAARLERCCQSLGVPLSWIGTFRKGEAKTILSGGREEHFAEIPEICLQGLEET